MKKLTLKNYHKIYLDFSINCFSYGCSEVYNKPKSKRQ
jgi:hypothetical protein